MNMYEYNKEMLNLYEQKYLLDDDSSNNEAYALCTICGCEEKVSEMYRDDVRNAYICYDCIDNYCDFDNALRFLAANELERDYFVRVYMSTECPDSADNRIVDACKNAWMRAYLMHINDHSYEFETLRDYVLTNEYWNDWVAAELLS